MTRKEAISRIQQALNVPNRLQGLVLIDEESANMAIEALSAEAEWIPCSEKLPDNKTYATKKYGSTVLTTIQAIDAVDVVRCKDCRHRDLFSCPLTDNDFQKDDDFCSWGERKGGDDE